MSDIIRFRPPSRRVQKQMRRYAALHEWLLRRLLLGHLPKPKRLPLP